MLLQVYKDLPSLLGPNKEQAVPIRVTVIPLKDVGCKESKIGREIQSDIVTKFEDQLNELESLRDELVEIIQQDVDKLPTMRTNNKTFLQLIEKNQTTFKMKIKDILSDVDKDQSHLLTEIETNYKKIEKLKSWMTARNTLSNNLDELLKCLQPGIDYPIVHTESDLARGTLIRSVLGCIMQRGVFCLGIIYREY